METTKIETIKRKTVHGVATLIGRSYILQIIASVGNFILSVMLLPQIFGVYWVVTAIIDILNYFADIGLAAALVQKNEEPTREDYVTTFTIQQFLVITAITIFFLLSSPVASFFNLKPEGIFLFDALLVSFFLSSLKTIPSIMLERQLEFGKKVIPQILETFVFYLFAIIFAMKGMGILSFAYAAIIRGAAGLLAMYIIRPWKVSIGISPKSARRLLSFGIPLQGGSLLALFKDNLLTLYLGKVLSQSPQEIGFIGWAKKWAETPLRNFMDSIISVSFPVYARIAEDKEILKKGVEKTLFFTSLLIFPSVAGLMLTIKPTMLFIPNHYFSKWEGALFSFYLFSLSAILASLSSPLVQVLNALGKAKTTFFLMLFWTIATWLLIPFMVMKIGYNGVAISSVIISLTAFLPMIAIKRYVNFQFFTSIYKPIIFTCIMTIVVFIVLQLLGSYLWGIILAVALGIGIYSGLAYLFAKQETLPYITLIRKGKK